MNDANGHSLALRFSCIERVVRGSNRAVPLVVIQRCDGFLRRGFHESRYAEDVRRCVVVAHAESGSCLSSLFIYPEGYSQVPRSPRSRTAMSTIMPSGFQCPLLLRLHPTGISFILEYDFLSSFAHLFPCFLQLFLEFLVAGFD